MSDDEPLSPTLARIAGAMLALGGSATLAAVILLDVLVLAKSRGNRYAVIGVVGSLPLFGYLSRRMLFLGTSVSRGDSSDIGSVLTISANAAVVFAGLGALCWKLPLLALSVGGWAAYFLTATLLAVAGKTDYLRWRAAQSRRPPGEP